MTTVDTLTPAGARTALSAVEQEKTEAEQLTAALAERVREGDPEVSPQQLAEARQLADFAELRITAAQRKLAAAEEADRQARARQLAEDAHRLADGDEHGVLADAIRHMAEAVNALVDLAHTRNNDIHSISNRVRDLDYEFGQAGAPGDLALRHGVARHPEGVIVTGEPMVARLSPAELLAAAVRLATGQSRVTEGELIQAFSGPDGTLARVLKAMPALADEWRYSPEEWAQMDRQAQAHAVAARRAPVGWSYRDPNTDS